MSTDIFEITVLSLKVSLLATGISLCIGLPLGTWLALSQLRGRGFLLSLINTGMALPPVVVGLFVAMMLWRSGPLGSLQLIYTPIAIIIAQTIICPGCHRTDGLRLAAVGPAPAPAAPGLGCLTRTGGSFTMEGSPPATPCRPDGWFW
jgi:tungstate transport system permease protein